MTKLHGDILHAGLAWAMQGSRPEALIPYLRCHVAWGMSLGGEGLSGAAVAQETLDSAPWCNCPVVYS